MLTSIIIPAHNEEKRIGKTLDSYAYFFEKKKKESRDFEIIVVLNACKDNTMGVVKAAEKKFREIKHLDFKEGGKGFAVIEGFKEALKDKAEIIGFVDADMATSPEYFYELIKKIGNYDGAIASRYVKNAKVYPKQSIARIFASRIFNFILRFLFFLPYKDTQCGAKIFRRKVIEKILPKLTITRWAFDVDLLYQARRAGFKIREIPSVWSDRAFSKIKLARSGIPMVLAIIRLKIINSPLKSFMRLYDRMPEWAKIHHRL